MGKKKSKYFDVAKIIKQKNPRLYKWLPRFFIYLIEALLRLKRHNEIMLKYGDLPAYEFIDRSLEYIGVKYEVYGVENLPQTSKILFAANHPLGGIDGMILATAIHNYKPDVKLIVNDILLNIHPLEPIFVGVNKHGNQQETLREQLDRLFASDIPIINFAAGLCSRKVKGQIVDTQWKPSFVQRCINSQRVVVPTYVDARNSRWFYFFAKLRKVLGIKANLEMVLLPRQVYFQRNKTVRIYFGEPIVMDKSRTIKEWSEAVRAEVYKQKQ